MGGVRTGTRLEQLEKLHRRVKHELESARRRDARNELVRLRDLEQRVAGAISGNGGTPVRPPQLAPSTPAAIQPHHNRVDRTLIELGVTAYDVKCWAFGQGLVPAIVRGRLAARLIDAYVDAHPNPTRSTPAS